MVGLGVVVDLVLGWWGVLVGLGFGGGCVGWQRGVCRGSQGYIYVLVCLYGFTLFALEVG